MRREVPVKPGQTCEIVVERFDSNAEGVGNIEGFTVFVPGALPGETVQLEIETVKKNYAVGAVTKRLTESAIRVAPRCPVYAACGGCQIQHISYPAQLELKRRQVSDAIERIGGLKGVSVLPVKGAENPWNYRNKMQFPVGREAGEIVIGCFAR